MTILRFSAAVRVDCRVVGSCMVMYWGEEGGSAGWLGFVLVGSNLFSEMWWTGEYSTSQTEDFNWTHLGFYHGEYLVCSKSVVGIEDPVLANAPLLVGAPKPVLQQGYRYTLCTGQHNWSLYSLIRNLSFLSLWMWDENKPAFLILCSCCKMIEFDSAPVRVWSISRCSWWRTVVQWM